jgi:Uma2 family endonuclease
MAQRVSPPGEPSFEELYRQIEALPEGVTGQILVPGTLHTMSRPGGRHQRALRRGYDVLGGSDRGRDGTGWWIDIEREIRFPRRRLAVPDLAGWRVENVPEFPDDNPIEIVPDWCCEVISPSTAQVDRHLKLPMYAECGVGWVWIVDPDARIVEVFETRDGKPLLVQSAAEDETISLAPFDVTPKLDRWWRDPPPDAPKPEGGGER